MVIDSELAGTFKVYAIRCVEEVCHYRFGGHIGKIVWGTKKLGAQS